MTFWDNALSKWEGDNVKMGILPVNERKSGYFDVIVMIIVPAIMQIFEVSVYRAPGTLRKIARENGIKVSAENNYLRKVRSMLGIQP